MICSHCLDDVDWFYMEQIDDDYYCLDCWPKVKEKVLKKIDHYKSIGHTGDQFCGCEMCAAKFERMMEAQA